MPIKSNVIPTLVAWIGASCAPLWAEGPPVAFHGYLRAGIGSTSGRGEQVAFQLPGARSKYRLGNESDDYGEFQIDAPLYQEAPGGGRFAFHGMLAVSDVGNTFTAAQYWIEGTDLVGGPFEGKHYGHLAKKYVTDTIRQLSPKLNLTAGGESDEGAERP